jgi:hypothetical protein
LGKNHIVGAITVLHPAFGEPLHELAFHLAPWQQPAASGPC